MKSFEQIAWAMYLAYLEEVYGTSAGMVSFADSPDFEKLGWIAAARAAHQQIIEVH